MTKRKDKEIDDALSDMEEDEQEKLQYPEDLPVLIMYPETLIFTPPKSRCQYCRGMGYVESAVCCTVCICRKLRRVN